jgi:amidase
MTQIDLTAVDATAQAEMVRSRVLPARQLVEATVQRIDEIEPMVNAFRVVTAEQALAHADRIDSLTDAELAKLPLAGVPVAIKDDTDVAGRSTMWGSAVDRGASENDAEVVRRLRRAGATIIGKTNVPELTLWPWTASERWGVTRNPWDLDRTAGGSSGGSAAAVSTGMAAMALGSDGGGSIRYPAGLTGLVGVKPQRDRVPLGPEHASGWHGLVVLGPLTRSVRDAALFLDAVSTPAPSTTLRDAIVEPARPLRVAVSTNPPPGTHVSLSPAARVTVERAADVLAGLGHEVVEVDIDYGLASLWSSTVRLLKGAEDDVASLPDRARLEARTRAVARLGRLIPARSLRRALERERQIAASINRVFDAADVVLTPLCESRAPLVDECPTRGALRSLRAANTSAWLVPWNVIGQPAIALPLGIDDDQLPTAVHLAGRADDEVTLLSLAAQIETARPAPRWSRPSPTDLES